MAEDRPRAPNPLTEEQVMKDMKNAPQSDVVFTSKPPKLLKGKGPLDKEVDRVASDSALLVSAYNNLKDCHQHELPHTINQVEQSIADLKAVISNRT